MASVEPDNEQNYDWKQDQQDLTRGKSFEEDNTTGALSIFLRVLTLHPRSGWIKKSNKDWDPPWLALYVLGLVLTASFLISNIFITWLVFSKDMQCAKEAGTKTHTETCVELWLYGVDEKVAVEDRLHLAIDETHAEEARIGITALIGCVMAYVLLLLTRYILPAMAHAPGLNVIAKQFGFFPKGEGFKSIFESEGGMGTYLAFWLMLVVTGLTWTAWGLLYSTKLEDIKGPNEKVTWTYEDGTGFSWLDIMTGFSTFLLFRFFVSFMIHSPNTKFAGIRSEHEERRPFVPYKLRRHNFA